MKKAAVLLLALLLLTACRKGAAPQETILPATAPVSSVPPSPVLTEEPADTVVLAGEESAVPVQATEAPETEAPAPETEPPVPETEAPAPTEPPICISQTGRTKAVPSFYTSTSSCPGTIVPLTYDTKDYSRDGAPIRKTTFVYLPYGYDENAETRYNILYLVNGWGGYAGEYFDYVYIKKLFDRLIENGDVEPMIIVSACFYNDNSRRDFDGSIEELHAFHDEFRNDLMPAVESEFRTYAASASDADLRASRDRRAFGGFSFGGVTTWLEFCYDSDYIRWFLPMSGGCWYYGTYQDYRFSDNIDFIEQLVRDNDLDARGWFIYHAVGTDDSYKTMSLGMADEILSRGVFSAEHYVFYQKQDGRHNYSAVQEYLYNALPLFFRGVG